MPTKNINKHWDEQDPNAEIPGQATKTIDDTPIEPAPRELEERDDDGKRVGEVQHVEKV